MKFFRLPDKRTRRALLLLGFTLLLICGATLGYRAYIQSVSHASLERILARLEREDPGWEWQRIVEARTPVSEEENGYRLIREINAIGNILPTRTNTANIFGKYHFPDPIPFEIGDWLGDMLGQRQKQVQLAVRIADFPKGRVPQSIDGSQNLVWINEVQQVASLIRWNSRANGQLSRIDDGLRDIHALLNLSRYLPEDEILTSMHVRSDNIRFLVFTLQEVLSRGSASVEKLAKLQHSLEEENRTPLLANCLRSSRAWNYEFFLRRMVDHLDYEKIETILSMYEVDIRADFSLLGNATLRFRYQPWVEHDLAEFLEEVTKYIDAAKGPEMEILPSFEEIQRERQQKLERDGFQIKRFISGIPHLDDSLSKIASAVHADRACLRCAILALATERFRLENQRWPKSVLELVPKYISELPKDPYSGQNLLMRFPKDGLAISSVGKTQVPEILGFRLWNPDMRRKALPESWSFLEFRGKEE
ncbi:hypothetical protein KIH39_20960 [Telmatocola sphagniphila]|uniref:Uncharacterized protein n=1 Tax=Telmatocola sphagniphila TaxID=1123043 RepID=A0A8E6B691_9BACT|nr:hypothetical protein [Telmatocola sphagniphila]QVL31293.1 hypothetical protein KIH39_20960 [Telmatocola sphagniphila]